MQRIEKTVFISYRRTNLPWAMAIYQDLTVHGYDVFFDFQSINSGDFSQIILENIKARAHFVILLTPSALERCEDPNDWFRREIEAAIDTKRNIVPLMLESFDFGSPLNSKYLTGKLALLKNYNGARIHSDYFDEGMMRLRDRYLNVSLDAVLYPVSDTVYQETQKQKEIANNAPEVSQKELTAQEWFEKGYKSGDNNEEMIYCYTQAILLKPDFAGAYSNRGIARRIKGDFDNAIKDSTEAIRLKPDDTNAYYNRGLAYKAKGNIDAAIKDYSEIIRLNRDNADAYLALSSLYSVKGDNLTALSHIYKSIKINPNEGRYRSSLVRILRTLERHQEASQQEQLARKIISKETEYNRACFEAICGNADKALELLKIGLAKNQATKEWARQDPDFENIRNNLRFKELVGE